MSGKIRIEHDNKRSKRLIFGEWRENTPENIYDLSKWIFTAEQSNIHGDSIKNELGETIEQVELSNEDKERIISSEFRHTKPGWQMTSRYDASDDFDTQMKLVLGL